MMDFNGFDHIDGLTEADIEAMYCEFLLAEGLIGKEKSLEAYNKLGQTSEVVKFESEEPCF